MTAFGRAFVSEREVIAANRKAVIALYTKVILMNANNQVENSSEFDFKDGEIVTHREVNGDFLRIEIVTADYFANVDRHSLWASNDPPKDGPHAGSTWQDSDFEFGKPIWEEI